MLALIAGQGELPRAVLDAQEETALICGMDHCPPDKVIADRFFSIERLGGFLRWLRQNGVTDVCLCGSVSRPPLRLSRIGISTWPLVPRVMRALRRGDDGALRIAIGILEGAGFRVLAAHEAAPSLLPAPGVWSDADLPDATRDEARLGDKVSLDQGRADLGQACVIRGTHVIAREDEDGTDSMLAALGATAMDGVLYKAPKPGQDRRADLPVIGPQTVTAAAAAGLRGIVIEAEGVMVLDQPRVRQAVKDAGMFLWIRERGA